MATRELNKIFCRTQLLPYGIRVFDPGNYGTIALRVAERTAPDGVSRRYSYLLSGVHNTSGRFPGVKEWHLAIRQIEGAVWSDRKGRYKIRLRDKYVAEEVNNILYPMLKQSIREYRDFASHRRQVLYEKRQANTLLGGLARFFEGALSNDELIVFVRQNLKDRILAVPTLRDLACASTKHAFSQSRELDDAIFDAILSLLDSDVSFDARGYFADPIIDGVKVILMGSGQLWESLRADEAVT